MLQLTQEKFQLIKHLDVEAFKKHTNCTDDEVALISLHKLRHAIRQMPEPLREESKKWLKDRNYRPLGGEDWDS